MTEWEPTTLSNCRRKPSTYDPVPIRSLSRKTASCSFSPIKPPGFPPPLPTRCNSPVTRFSSFGARAGVAAGAVLRGKGGGPFAGIRSATVRASTHSGIPSLQTRSPPASFRSTAIRFKSSQDTGPPCSSPALKYHSVAMFTSY